MDLEAADRPGQVAGGAAAGTPATATASRAGAPGRGVLPVRAALLRRHAPSPGYGGGQVCLHRAYGESILLLNLSRLDKEFITSQPSTVTSLCTYLMPDTDKSHRAESFYHPVVFSKSWQLNFRKGRLDGRPFRCSEFLVLGKCPSRVGGFLFYIRIDYQTRHMAVLW